MRSWVLAASLLAAAATTGAKAADLDEGPPPDRYGSAYDDPRYADIYKYPRGPQAYGVPPPGAYGSPYAGPSAGPPPPYADPPRYAGPPPYAGPRSRASASIAKRKITTPATLPDHGAIPTPSRPRRSPGRCAPRELVKERLFRDGWRDFHDGELRGEIATIRRAPSERPLFVLSIHRCSGDIVRADPLEGRSAGPMPMARHRAAGQGRLRTPLGKQVLEASARAGAFLAFAGCRRCGAGPRRSLFHPPWLL